MLAVGGALIGGVVALDGDDHPGGDPHLDPGQRTADGSHPGGIAMVVGPLAVFAPQLARVADLADRRIVEAIQPIAQAAGVATILNDRPDLAAVQHDDAPPRAPKSASARMKAHSRISATA